MNDGDIEWVEDDDDDRRQDEELAAGSERLPLRRRTRLALGAVAVAVLATAVTVAVTTGSDDRPDATPTRTVTPSHSAPTLQVDLPSRPPATALAAIRDAFPKGELTGFSAALAAGTRRDVFTFFNVTSGRRMITITLGPVKPGEMDAVSRTATSLGIAQPLGRSRVQIELRVTRGAPTARDFAAIQRLVQDVRLLATA